MDGADQLLGLIYDAALDPTQWSTVFATLADAIGGVGAHVVVLDKAPELIGGVRPRLKISGTRHMDPTAADRYMNEWYALDPLIPTSGNAVGPPGTILQCHEFISADFVSRSSYFQDFLVPAGGRYQSGVTLVNDQHSLAVLDVHTRNTPLKRERLMEWAPMIAHLRRAVRIGAVLKEGIEQGLLLRQAVDREGMICVMVRSEARVIDHSEAGAEMLADGDSIRLTEDGLVRLGDDATTGRLRALIGQACNGRAGGEIPLVLAGLRSAVVHVVPAGVACDNPFSQRQTGCALLFVERSKQRQTPDPSAIRLKLGCTLAEAEVAAALASGRAPQEIATARSTSIYTVRAQIRRLLDTTGAHRISKLISIVHADVIASGSQKSSRRAI
ncbi:hypothetical protein [Rhodopila sp.]|uniref:hypothetical protein n=1 Tax=Rhodopila sp. TaxID=2480087 RepID=UPI003D0D4DA6